MTTSGGGQVRSRAAMDAGRRRRLSLEEVEKLVMAKARELLITETGGLTVSLDHINLEVIIAAAGVPRSSAHRRWPTKDAFVVDFLCDIAGPNWFGTAAFDRDTISVAIGVVQKGADLLATEEGRVALIREAVRVGAKQNFDAIVASNEWRTYVALTATVISIPDEEVRNRIKSRLREAETTFIERMTTFYAGMSAMLGFRPKAPYTFRHLAAAGAAIVEGLSLRRIVNLELVTEPLQLPDPDGVGTTEWTLAAAGFLAILESMIEINPDHQTLDEQQRADFAGSDTEQLVAMIAPEMLA